MTSYLHKFFDAFNTINSATLSGAIDVIVVEHPDGTLYCTPFHVRFGKLQLLQSHEKIVTVKVNGADAPEFAMKLGRAGEAFFVIETDEPVGGDFLTSPLGAPEGSSDADEQPTAFDLDAQPSENKMDPDAADAMDAEDAQGKMVDDDHDVRKFVDQETAVDIVVDPMNRPRAKSRGNVTDVYETKTAREVAALAEQVENEGAQENPFKAAEDAAPKGDHNISIDDPAPLARGLSQSQAEEDEKKWEWAWGGLPERTRMMKRVMSRSRLLAKSASSSGLNKLKGHRSHRSSRRSRQEAEENDSDGDLPLQPFASKSGGDGKQPQHRSKRGWVRSIFGGWFYRGSQTSIDQNTLAAARTSVNEGDGDAKNNDRAPQLSSPRHHHRVSQRRGSSDAAKNTSNEVEMSLCGHLLADDVEHNTKVFQENVVSYSRLCSDPSAVFDPNLVFRSQDRLYPSHIALPLLLSKVVYGKPLTLTDQGLSDLSKLSEPNYYAYMPGDQRIPPSSSGDLAVARSPEVDRRTAQTAPLPDENTKGYDSDEDDDRVQSSSVPPAHQRGWFEWFRRRRPSADTTITEEQAEALQIPSSPQDRNDSKSAPPTLDQSDPNQIYSDTASDVEEWRAATGLFYRKSLRPTEEMLQSLELNYGRNTVQFIVHSNFQGKQVVDGCIYLWKSDAKIVISDIDGTITKSDILGNIMPLVGRDWSHTGVTKLFSDIQDNGYHILYLTARAIGQANVTRGYIDSLQQGEYKLPLGPVLMSPDRLVSSFKREVIDRTPHEFKILCLRDVRLLFALFGIDGMPPSPLPNPFYAGFGNRPSDVLSYRAVGVPVPRIFIINPTGQISHVNQQFVKSYPELNSMVDSMFPAHDAKTSALSTEFSSHNYWTPAPDQAPGDFDPKSAPSKSFFSNDRDDDSDDDIDMQKLFKKLSPKKAE